MYLVLTPLPPRSPRSPRPRALAPTSRCKKYNPTVRHDCHLQLAVQPSVGIGHELKHITVLLTTAVDASIGDLTFHAGNMTTRYRVECTSNRN